MKLAIAITLSALLTGCAVASDEIDLERTYPDDDVEIVVLEPGDIAEIELPDDFGRPLFPSDGYDYVAVEDKGHHLDIPDRPGRDPFPSGGVDVSGEGPSGRDVKVPPSNDLNGTEFPRNGDSVYDTSSDSYERTFPEERSDVASDEMVSESVCDCDSTECLEDWIDRHLGCDVCATFICSDDYKPGACNMC